MTLKRILFLIIAAVILAPFITIERILLLIIGAAILSPFVSIPQFIGAIRRKDKKQFLRLLVMPILLMIASIPAYLILIQMDPSKF